MPAWDGPTPVGCSRAQADWGRKDLFARIRGHVWAHLRRSVGDDGLCGECRYRQSKKL